MQYMLLIYDAEGAATESGRRAFVVDTDPEQMRRTLDDLCQVGARIKVQVIVLAETVAQRRTQESASLHRSS